MHSLVRSTICDEARCLRFRGTTFLNITPIAEHSCVTDEVNMAFIRLSSVRTTAEMVSNILNCICPECGGRMGERGKEFKCQGECKTDWRLTWERLFSVRR
jgi:tRNA(Ile2) C34 agmatinyltransferase TiaS